MIITSCKESPIHGEIRLKNKDSFDRSFGKFIQYKENVSGYATLYFEFKKVRFRLTYSSTYSHIQFHAWSCLGWKNADSIYDYANTEYIRELGTMLSKKFHCCVRLTWFRRVEKGSMRFRDGEVWECERRMPSEKPFEKKEDFVYFTDLVKPFLEKNRRAFHFIEDIVKQKNEKYNENNNKE